jgi:DNA helicase II / ATP-dependent DNA helicase PcrA
MVDEFQDTNLLQYRLVRSVFEGQVVKASRPCTRSVFKDRSLAVVGDPDQAIYGFRGGDVDLILGFSRDYPGSKIVSLGENFRSQRLIVSAAAAVISNNSRRTPKHIQARATFGLPIRLVEASPDAIPRSAAEICRGLWSRTDGKAQIAALFRHNAELEAFRQSADMPVRRTDGVFFEDLPEVRGIAALVNAARDPRSDYWLWETSRAVLPHDRRLPHLLRQRQHAQGLALWDILSTSNDSEAVIVRGAVLAVIEAGRHGPVRQITEAARQTGWLSSLHAGATAQARERLEELSSRLLTDRDPFKALLARSEGFLELLTAHKSKGLEREYIILPGDNYPDSKDDAEEERRLFFVALTRARNQVYIIHTTRPSPFLREIPEEMVTRTRV